MSQVGCRVGAILSADDTEVRLLGFGVYEGEKPCPDLDGLQNPCIKLDNGTIVWGYECWWGDEGMMKRWIGQRKVTQVEPVSEGAEAGADGANA